MQGVSINIFVKRGTGNGERGTGGPRFVAAADGTKPVPPCRVYHAEVFGEREAKYGFLDAHDIANVEYKELAPKAPHYFFVPKDFALQEEYEKGFSVAELFSLYNSGIQTKRDKLTVSFLHEDVLQVINDFKLLPPEELRAKYNLPADGRDWTVNGAKADLISHEASVIPYCYRPFDIRHIAYTGFSKGFIAYPRDKVMGSFVDKDNLALLTCRFQTTFVFQHAFVTNLVSDLNSVSMQTGEQSFVFPLYLYTDNMGKVEKTPNLNPEIVKKIEEALRASASPRETITTPEDIFHYIYAVLHTPSYRSRYREFLKVDFPRIPYPASAEEFRRLASIGEKLVSVHLLKDPKVRDMFSPYANFPVAGDSNVANMKMLPMSNSNAQLGTGNSGNNGNNPVVRVYINSTQYFDNVPETAWNFYVGGYQPAQKWLKDRKGRTLTSDDILHYKAIIAALVETQRLMDELREISARRCDQDIQRPNALQDLQPGEELNRDLLYYPYLPMGWQ